MKAVLLVNLGTPDAPTTPALRRYLREFLSDPEVIDLPWMARMLLVHGIIVPFRAPKSAEAYRAIWTEKGSPLRFHSLSLAEKVSRQLGSSAAVEIGMRYGNPSFESALQSLRQRTEGNLDELVVMPLYPQYAASTVKSTLLEVRRVLARMKWNPPLRVISPFYRHPAYLEAQAEVIRPLLDAEKHLVFSFHGIPERHILRESPQCGDCLPQAACARLQHDLCYRGQCFDTAHGVARLLGLKPDQYSVSFQSRLGRTPWIRPYTDHHLATLLEKGIRKVVVACPAFVADCLETLEEIGMREKEKFLHAGGERFEEAPCLNDTDTWTGALVKLIQSSQENFHESVSC